MRIAIAFLLFAVSTAASADYFTGDSIEQQLLNTNDPSGVTMFMGYVAGISDVFNDQLFCIPPDVHLSQTSAVVKKYLSDNPRLWNKPAKELVVNSLRSAFPCKKSN